MLTNSQQKILLKIHNSDNDCYVNDFVPSIYKYHSSFYRAIKDLKLILSVEKEVLNGRNVFRLNFDGKIFTNLLKILTKGDK